MHDDGNLEEKQLISMALQACPPEHSSQGTEDSHVYTN
jgi:hypothetical protein